MNGEPLPAMHGYPLRLLVPGWYGMNSIKWLVGIKVIDHKFDGFYQTERYMVMNGPGADSFYTYLNEMRVKSIITNPMPGRSWRWAHTGSRPPGRARRKSFASRSARIAGRLGRRPNSRQDQLLLVSLNSAGSHHGRATIP
jgi:DMSO/TMAO reductase YedYZ molybdopterin-dependent catalytic subunit